jgi:hypothetical protein
MGYSDTQPQTFGARRGRHSACANRARHALGSGNAYGARDQSRLIDGMLVAGADGRGRIRRPADAMWPLARIADVAQNAYE